MKSHLGGNVRLKMGVFHVGSCSPTAELIFVCMCVLGYHCLSLGSLSRGQGGGEQMARRGSLEMEM